MKLLIQGNNIAVTEAIHDYVEQKLEKAVKHFNGITTKVDVHLSVEKNARIPDRHKAPRTHARTFCRQHGRIPVNGPGHERRQSWQCQRGAKGLKKKAATVHRGCPEYNAGEVRFVAAKRGAGNVPWGAGGGGRRGLAEDRVLDAEAVEHEGRLAGRWVQVEVAGGDRSARGQGQGSRQPS